MPRGAAERMRPLMKIHLRGNNRDGASRAAAALQEAAEDQTFTGGGGGGDGSPSPWQLRTS